MIPAALASVILQRAAAAASSPLSSLSSIPSPLPPTTAFNHRLFFCKTAGLMMSGGGRPDDHYRRLRSPSYTMKHRSVGQQLYVSANNTADETTATTG